MRSTSDYCFTLGFGMFSWCSKKQEVILQSTAEAKYMTVVAAVNQAHDRPAHRTNRKHTSIY